MLKSKQAVDDASLHLRGRYHRRNRSIEQRRFWQIKPSMKADNAAGLRAKKRLSSQRLGQVVSWREGEPSFKKSIGLRGRMLAPPRAVLLHGIGYGLLQLLDFSWTISNKNYCAQ
jgi:hypothetical protein